MSREAVSPFALGNLKLWKNGILISNDLRFRRADAYVNAQAILIPIAIFPIWQLKLFPPSTVFCIDVRNGEAVKLYNSDCQQSDRLNIVEQ